MKLRLNAGCLKCNFLHAAVFLFGFVCLFSGTISFANSKPVSFFTFHTQAMTALSQPNLDSSGYKPYALVAGGSKGIGFAIAVALAKRGYNLVLVARHMDSLLAAKQKIEDKYDVQVEIISYDLSLNSAAVDIARWCEERQLPLKMLCNVAGFGGSKDYLSLSLDSLRYMSNLNVESCMALSLTLLPLLEKNAPSYILNVASMAGFAPIPAKNFYSATKSAVIFFSYSLRYQLEDKNISVSVLCPGPVYTKPEIVEETKKKLGFLGKLMALQPAKVGEVAVKKTFKGKLVIVPGTFTSIVAWVIRTLPRRWVVAIYDKLG